MLKSTTSFGLPLTKLGQKVLSPHIYKAPSSVMHPLSPPAHIFVMKTGSKALIFVGTLMSLLLPRPSCPLLFLPVLRIDPLILRKRVKFSPQDTSLISETKAFVGISWFSRFPVPNWPYSPLPQVIQILSLLRIAMIPV